MGSLGSHVRGVVRTELTAGNVTSATPCEIPAAYTTLVSALVAILPRSAQRMAARPQATSSHRAIRSARRAMAAVVWDRKARDRFAYAEPGGAGGITGEVSVGRSSGR
jgi:hypothetical protein